MANRVLLNNIDHHDLRVAIRYGAAFGDAANQILIFPTEFEEVQREFPILFRRGEDGRFRSFALLGLDPGENLFLTAAGWSSRYIPAVQQRGPFSIGLQAGSAAGAQDPMVHVDLDDPRVGEQEGLPLFRTHGGNAPYLDHVTRVLQRIHTGLELSDPMFEAFIAADLIEPVTLQIELDDTRRYDLPDCFTIGSARLSALDRETLGQLHRAGFLRAAFMVASSLSNVSRLIDLKNRIRAHPGPMPEPA